MNTGMLSLWISFLIAGVVMPLIPYMTRKTENFGVTVPEHMYNRTAFSKMRKQYTVLLFIFLFVLIVLSGIAAFFLPAKVTALIMSMVLLIYVVASFLLYLPFHYKMKSLKANEQWQKEKAQTVVVDTAFREEKLVLSNWWFLVPGIFTIVTIALTFYFYDMIPDEIPMHEDFSGNVRYDAKSIGNLLLMPAMQVFMLALFLGVNLIIKHSKQQVNAEHPDRSKQQNILFRRRWSAYTIVSAMLIILLFSYIQLSFIYPTLESYADILITIVIAVILIGTIVLSITTGQGGGRIKVDGDHANEKINRDDDEYWKLGQFYVNKNDPSIFVEKRFGVGWTNNWAHPVSWLLIIAVIAVPIIITAILVFI